MSAGGSGEDVLGVMPLRRLTQPTTTFCLELQPISERLDATLRECLLHFGLNPLPLCGACERDPQGLTSSFYLPRALLAQGVGEGCK